MDETKAVGPGTSPPNIAPHSPAVERAKRKAEEQLKKEKLETEAYKTEQVVSAIKQRQAHNPHDEVAPGRSEESPEIQALRQSLDAELQSDEQKKVAEIAARRFGR